MYNKYEGVFWLVGGNVVRRNGVGKTDFVEALNCNINVLKESAVESEIQWPSSKMNSWPEPLMEPIVSKASWKK
jgi:AAA15 family ATPase/GTPase